MAGTFAALTRTVDPEAPADLVVGLGDNQRTAWTELPLLSSELDALRPAMQASAWLAPVYTYRDSSMLLSLVIDAGGAPRHQVWTAWGNKGRCGRRGSIDNTGATIRAAGLSRMSGRTGCPRSSRMRQSLRDDRLPALGGPRNILGLARRIARLVAVVPLARATAICSNDGPRNTLAPITRNLATCTRSIAASDRGRPQ